MSRFSSAARVVFLSILAFYTSLAFGQAGLVISQIYGAGGNSSATFNADFVEIYNPTSSAISTSGLSIQYASATGNFTQALALTATTIQPGHYFLVQTTAAGTTGASLPTADTSGTAPNLSATNGKVALVNGTAALSSDTTCTLVLADPAIIDMVGYGTANCFKGTAAAPTTANNTQSIIRTVSAVNTNNNSADFSLTSPPNPRNSSFGSTTGSLSATGSASPASVIAGQSTTLTVTVTPATSPASTGIAVTGDLRQIGGSQTQSFASSGSNTFSYTSTVTTSSSGSISLPITVTDQQLNTASATITLAVSQPAPVVEIHDIQGVKSTTAMTVSPYVGQKVTTSGVVTAVLSNGFFIQSQNPDANPLTPEGIEVFTSSAPPAAAVVGNVVSVTGTVATFPATTASHTPATEISGSPTVTLVSTGNTLPTPVILTTSMLTASGGLYQLTPYEGMRVSVPSMTAVSGTNGSITSANEPTETATSTGYFYAVITGTARPFREPGIDIRDTLIPGTPSGVAMFDDNPERILVDSTIAGGTSIEIATGAVLTNMTGVLDFTFSSDSFYDPSRLILDATYNRANVTAGMTVQAVPVPASGEFTVASYNIERFYNTSAADDLYYVPSGVTGFNGNSSSGTTSSGQTFTSAAVDVTSAAYTRRLQKLSLTVRNVLNLPDVVTLEEVENQSVANDIAAQINTDAGIPNLYSAYSTDNSTYYTQDGTGISVGFLVKNTVNALSVTQFGQGETFNNGSITLNDRPWLVLKAGVKRANAKDYPVTVIVNHMRSLSSINANTSSGANARTKKELQAEDIAKYIQSLQASGTHVISGGDFNAFEFSDGLTDTLASYTNVNVLPATQVLLPGVAGLVNPPLTDMTLTLPASQRWSYVEDGNAQVLDHIVVTPELVTAGAHLAYAHVNADFPVTAYNDATTAARSSDHDIAVGYFKVPTPVLSGQLTPSTTTNFGSTTIGASSAGQQFVFTNTGEGPVTVSGVTVTGDYSVGTNCNNTSVAFGSTCTVNVVFKPTATGIRTGTIAFATNVSGSTFSGSLTGTGVAPPLPTLSPTTQDFGSVILNVTSAAKIFTVTNSATVPVAVSSVAVTGDYSQTNTCGTSIAASATCNVSVVFKPTAAGSRSGTVTVTTSGAAATTLTSTLTGTGLLPDFTLGDGTGAATTSLTVSSGNSGSVSLTFTSVNGFTGTVTLTCTPPAKAPLGVTCTTPGSFTVSGSTTQTITFATTGRFFSSGVAGQGLWGWLLAGLIGLAGAGMFVARRGYRLDGRVWSVAAMLLLALAVCMPISGCAKPEARVNPNGTVAGTYPYTITATSGSLSHTETVNLIVQ